MNATLTKILVSTWWGVIKEDGTPISHKEASCTNVEHYLNELLNSCREEGRITEFEITSNSDIVVADIKYEKSSYVHLRWQNHAMMAVLSTDVNKLIARVIKDISNEYRHDVLALYFMRLAVLSDMCALNYEKIHKQTSGIKNVILHLNPMDDDWDLISIHYEDLNRRREFRGITLPDWWTVYDKLQHFNAAVGYERRLL